MVEKMYSRLDEQAKEKHAKLAGTKHQKILSLSIILTDIIMQL